MKLLLLTKVYPYGSGEAFIENEIDIMSMYFEDIIIISCEVPSNIVYCRKVPDNVTVYRINSSKKIKDILKSIKYLFLKEKVFQEEKKACKKIYKKLFLGYFEEKSYRIYNTIIQQNILQNSIKEGYVIYSYWLFLTARIATLISDNYNTLYMFSRAHRYDLYEEVNYLKYLPYRRYFINKFDNIFPCSIDGRKYLNRKHPGYEKKIVTALLGTVDYGIGKEKSDKVFRIVTCSRVEPVKRIDLIVDALHEIDGMEVNIVWTHIGDGSCIEKIKKSANKKLKKVKYEFKGNMQNENIMDIYKNENFDLFLNVSSSEGIPVSIMEALSFGIPAMATDVGGNSEVVIDGVTGRLLKKDISAHELAEELTSFIFYGYKAISRDMCRNFWKNNFQARDNYFKFYDFIKKKIDIKLDKIR